VANNSASAYSPAFAATSGWDFATGIGTVNAFNLVAALSTGQAGVTGGGASFAAQALTTSSTTKNLTLTNIGLTTLTISAIALSGGNAGDFNLTHTCPGTLAPAATCILHVTFTPTVAGPRKTGISVTDSYTKSPQIFPVTGVGTLAGLSPTSLAFSIQTVSTSSTPKVVTITNKGSGTMNLWQIAILGTNAGDFSKTTTCGATLGAGLNCTVSVTFKPTATGARTASLLFSDDGGASPQSVPLSGTGI
jgi:archaellum component FlaF (FlaF/FlaG flagellin family)